MGANVAVTVLVLGLVGVACAPGFDMVRTDPSLYPAFQMSVTDYVNRCDPNNPTDVSVSTPDGWTVSVDGGPAQTGNFQTQIDQQVNEAFTIVVNDGTATTSHYVRCLPLDFPEWEATREGTTQAEFYATVVIEGFNPNIPVIFDTNGVPVWWTERVGTFSNEPLPNGNLANLRYGGELIERQLDGTRVPAPQTQGANGDFHDVEIMPNGNYVMATFDVRDCDLRPWGEGQGRCAHHTFQELTPGGQLVWSWAAEEDIPLSETPVKWRSERDPQFGYVDPWHYNSVEWDGTGFIISLRHMDAIYKVDYQTKNIVWKLGGQNRPESLRFVGDPIGSFSGQHDARWLGDGVVSLFDNQSRTGRPRSVAYRIDTQQRTATLVSQITDSVAPVSGCCGSTRVMPGGNQVTGWGGGPWFTENQPNGQQVFRLDANFLYRAIPITDGRYTREELRAGMDAQYDDGVFAPDGPATAAAESPLDFDLGFRLGLQED
ncbi:MAG: arylsulfotransferase family protein [Ilumatobacteraceae bacterium]